MPKVKAQKHVLSFEVEEEEEEEENFQVKKSKQSRKFKKMRQAPVTLSQTEEVTHLSTAAFGGSYGSDTLNSLRQTQKFAPKLDIVDDAPMSVENDDNVYHNNVNNNVNNNNVNHNKANDHEPIELSGEAAEELVQLLEEQNSGVIKKDLNEEDAADFLALQSAKISNHDLLKEKKDRIYTTVNQPSINKLIDLNEENDSDWENEIMKRGIIGSIDFNVRNKEKEKKILEKNEKNNNFDNNIDDDSGKLKILNVLKSVKNVVEKLQNNEEVLNNRIHQLTIDCENSEKDQKKLKESLENNVAKINIINETRECLSNLVGMLREKKPFLDQLITTGFKAIQDFYSTIKTRDIEEQEDIVYRIKEIGEMIGIGSYEPKSILSLEKKKITISDLYDREEKRRKLRILLLKNQFSNLSDNNQLLLFASGRVDEMMDLYTENEVLNDKSDDMDVGYNEENVGFGLGFKNESIERKKFGLGFNDLNTETNKNEGIKINIKNGKLYDLLRYSNYLDRDFDNDEEIKMKNFEKIQITIKTALNSIFEDVENEVYSIKTILNHVENFKLNFPDKYNDAFIGLSVCELLENLVWIDLFPFFDIFIEQEIGKFNEISVKNLSFEDRMWFKPLQKFQNSHKSALTLDEVGSNGLGFKEKEDNQDVGFLDHVFEKVVIPWFSQVIDTSLDVKSSIQTEKCLHVLRQLQNYYPRVKNKDENKESEWVKISSAIENKFRTEFNEFLFPVTKIVILDENTKFEGLGSDVFPGIGRSFLNRQLHCLLQFIANLEQYIAFGNGLIASGVAVTMVWKVLSEICASSLVKMLKTQVSSDVIRNICVSAVKIIENNVKIESLANYGIAAFEFKLLKLVIDNNQSNEEIMKVLSKLAG